jgi:hypothetical protein
MDDLRKWTVLNNITQSALKALIRVINENFNQSMPIDPRTIMKTPKSVNFVQIGNGANPGFYWHQGLEFCLRNCFKNLTENISISININIDGLPLYNSSNKNFWPVL